MGSSERKSGMLIEEFEWHNFLSAGRNMYKEVDLGKDLMRLDFSDRNVVSIERVVRVESFSEFFGIENMPVLFS